MSIWFVCLIFEFFFYSDLLFALGDPPLAGANGGEEPASSS
jgi:hypothetical protein